MKKSKKKQQKANALFAGVSGSDATVGKNSSSDSDEPALTYESQKPQHD